jgi:hypothetical protein
MKIKRERKGKEKERNKKNKKIKKINLRIWVSDSVPACRLFARPPFPREGSGPAVRTRWIPIDLPSPHQTLRPSTPTPHPTLLVRISFPFRQRSTAGRRIRRRRCWNRKASRQLHPRCRKVSRRVVVVAACGSVDDGKQCFGCPRWGSPNSGSPGIHSTGLRLLQSPFAAPSTAQ